MNFGEALQALKEGFRVRRSIWEGHWYLAKNVILDHAPITDDTEPGDITGCRMKSLIIAVLKDNKGCAPAMPYQEDILAEDWLIIE